MYQALVTLDPVTLLAQIVNLLIQMFIVKHFLLDKVMKILDERRDRADAQLADAEKAKREAQAARDEYEQGMAQARENANRLVAEAQRTAAQQSEAIVSDAQQQAAAIRRKAEEDIALEKKKALNDVKNEIGGMAMEIASRVVEREINEADHRELIDEFIRNVGDAS